MKALELKNSMCFTFVFANSAIYSSIIVCLFFFLIIELYFLILGVIAQCFSPFPEIVITLQMPTQKQ